MKMTVEIPGDLFRRAKIRAVERGGTMRELVMAALERELAAVTIKEEATPYFVRRKPCAEFARLAREGALRGGADASDLIGDERDGR